MLEVRHVWISYLFLPSEQTSRKSREKLVIGKKISQVRLVFFWFWFRLGLSAIYHYKKALRLRDHEQKVLGPVNNAFHGTLDYDTYGLPKSSKYDERAPKTVAEWTKRLEDGMKTNIFDSQNPILIISSQPTLLLAWHKCIPWGRRMWVIHCHMKTLATSAFDSDKALS